MSYLLDTCILSKARKINQPDSDKLRRWLDKHPDANFFISVISIGEIQAGISKLKKEESVKKNTFENWLLGDLVPRFGDRILPVDVSTCFIWGQLRGEAQKQGVILPATDALIAATAIQYQMILVTENVRDFTPTGVPIFNPLAN
jgi:predicted nucleic acid-binding protein